MGIMDKAKTLAQQTKDSATAGMAKLDQSQSGRKADGMLRSLGLAVLAERTGRGTGDTSAQINQMLSDLSAHETQFSVNLVQQAAQVQAQQLANQMRPGEFLSSSDHAVDPNVPGGAPAYGGAPADGGPASFPQTGQPTGFPGAGQPTGFPDAGQPAGFPGAAPTGFPAPVQSTGFPAASSLDETPAAQDEPTPGGFPPATGFPPSSGV